MTLNWNGNLETISQVQWASNLSLWCRLHHCLNHFVGTSTNGLYTITIRRSIWTIWRPPTLSINLSLVFLHSFIQSSLLIVRTFSWLLSICQYLGNKSCSQLTSSGQIMRKMCTAEIKDSQDIKQITFIAEIIYQSEVRNQILYRETQKGDEWIP